MTNFDPALHPRGHASNQGSFSEKAQSAPETALYPAPNGPDLSTLPVGEDAANAAIVAAAGGHHTLFRTTESSLERTDALVAQIAAASGRHVITVPANATGRDLIGTSDKPGLLAQAHDGILYIPRAAHLDAAVLDILRQPLGSGLLIVQHAGSGGNATTYDADFQLILASSDCPCGRFREPGDQCECTPTERRRHLNRLSGPLLDRVDIQTNVAAKDAPDAVTSEVTFHDLVEGTARAKTAAAARLAGSPWTKWANVPGSHLRSSELRLSPIATATIDHALERGGITMRGYDRVLRLAWTLADIDGADKPSATHITKALGLRRPSPREV